MEDRDNAMMSFHANSRFTWFVNNSYFFFLNPVVDTLSRRGG